MKNWAVAWFGMSPQDTQRGWGWLIWGGTLRSMRTLDAMSDLSLAALIYYAHAAGVCAWEGENNCAVFLKLLLAVAVPACADYFISVLFIFWPAAKHGRTHTAMHIVSLACEISIFTVTVLLQQYSYPGASVSATSSTGQSGSAWARLFFVGSGILNVVTTSMNLIGLNNLHKFVTGACIARKAAAVAGSVQWGMHTVPGTGWDSGASDVAVAGAPQLSGYCPADSSFLVPGLRSESNRHQAAPGPVPVGLAHDRPRAGSAPLRQETTVGNLVFEASPLAGLMTMLSQAYQRRRTGSLAVSDAPGVPLAWPWAVGNTSVAEPDSLPVDLMHDHQ